MNRLVIHRNKTEHPGSYSFTVDPDNLVSHNKHHRYRIERTRLLPVPPPPCGLPQKAKAPDLQIPLPPCIFQPPSTNYSSSCIKRKLSGDRKFDVRMGLKKIYHSRLGLRKQERDPFLAAYKECTKSSSIKGKWYAHRKLDLQVGVRKVYLSTGVYWKQGKIKLLTASRDYTQTSIRRAKLYANKKPDLRSGLRKIDPRKWAFGKQDNHSSPTPVGGKFGLGVDLKKIYSGFRMKDTNPFLNAFKDRTKSSSLRSKMFGDKRFDLRVGARKILSKLSCKKLCDVKDAIQVGVSRLTDRGKSEKNAGRLNYV